jgi:hypothetical protein
MRNMMEEKKKVAAISAVFQYISDEEKALISQEDSQSSQSSIHPISFWGITGRQAAMQMRNLMQMKAFHAHK